MLLINAQKYYAENWLKCNYVSISFGQIGIFTGFKLIIAGKLQFEPFSDRIQLDPVALKH